MLYLDKLRKLDILNCSEDNMEEYIEDFISYLMLERKLSFNTQESYQFDLMVSEQHILLHLFHFVW